MICAKLLEEEPFRLNNLIRGRNWLLCIRNISFQVSIKFSNQKSKNDCNPILQCII